MRSSSQHTPGVVQLCSLLFLCGISLVFVGCGTSAPSHTAAVTATASPAPAASATPSSTGGCPSLDMIITAIQPGQNESVGFTLTSSQTAVNGNLASYTAGPPQTLTGSGYNDGTNNDLVQIQIKRIAQQVAITITDTVTHQVTTYAVTGCTTESSTGINLTGSSPVAFTVGLDITPK
jgi:hypothetical protein